MVKRCLMLAALAALPCIAAAQPSDLSSSQPMIRLVVRNVSPGVAPGSFTSRPRTIYRVGEHYVRVEEELDPADGVHDVLIRAQRDTWLVDLAHRTIQHAVGQTDVAHIPIVDETNIRDLELGTEPQFLHDHAARVIGTGEAGLDLKEVRLGRYLVHATTKHGTDTPVKLEVGAIGSPPVVVLQYDEYSTHLPADATLFEPPSGSFRTTEMKQ